jgi:hypothetical protein
MLKLEPELPVPQAASASSLPPSHVCSSFSSCAATLLPGPCAGRVIGGVAAAAGAGVVATLVVAIVIVTRRRRQPVGASLRLIGHRAVPPRPAGQAVQVRVSGRRPSPSRPDPASQRPQAGGRTWTVAAITDGGVPITGTGSSRGLSPSRRTPARGRQGRGASGHQLPLVPVAVARGPGAAALDPASGSDASGASTVTRSSGRRNLKAHRKHGAQKSLKRAAGTASCTGNLSY